MCVRKDESEDEKNAISVEQTTTLSEHRKKKQKEKQTHFGHTYMLHTWLISHLSTTRFKCSFPLLFALWAMISWFSTQLMLLCGRARLVHSIFFISPCAELHYRAFFISHSIWRISIKLSSVHHTAVCVCVQCVGASEYVWICVSFGCFWHISFITFSQVIYGHTAAVVATSSSCVPHCLCVYGASLAGKINHVSKSRAYACTGRWMDGWMASVNRQQKEWISNVKRHQALNTWM